MKTIDLAAGLGISTQMTNRLIKQGMPRDLDKAIAWRKSHLQPFRTKSTRIGGNSGKPYQSAQINKSAIASDEVYCAEEISGVTKALRKIVPNLWFSQIGWLATALREQGVKVTPEQLIGAQSILFLIYMETADDLLKSENPYTVPASLMAKPGDEIYPSLIASLNQLLSEDNAAE
ncbi:hypothetical protein Nit79A3_2061 [Nitrosomonas sp. Is79A3]|uniref:hypothetical protein n=1 Tax=Nitrosomonas sp. (strain Is79A3) TaxID=261292 RepID=UPI000215D0E6